MTGAFVLIISVFTINSVR